MTAAFDPQTILAEVRTNLRKLDECLGPHDFQPAQFYPGGVLVKRYRCTKCSGEADHNAVRWYRHGLKHGGRS